MEDEEGYTALKPWRSRERSTRCSPVQRAEGVTRWPKQSKILLGILGAVCISLGLTLIWMTVLVFQSSCHNNRETARDLNGTKSGTRSLQDLKRMEGSYCTEDIITHLCEPFTRGSKCKLCPLNWTSLEEKCYWVSKDKKAWLEAYNYCAGKRAQILVVLDRKEMEFIQSFTEEKYPIWIGLNSAPDGKRWTWADHSVLDHDLFSLPPPMTRDSCGVLKGKQLHSEMCSAEFRWVCEKEVLVF